jgi:DNA-binding transcriptional regulator YiaG
MNKADTKCLPVDIDYIFIIKDIRRRTRLKSDHFAHYLIKASFDLQNDEIMVA